MRGLCNRDICYAVSLLGSVRYSEFERLSHRGKIFPLRRLIKLQDNM